MLPRFPSGLARRFRTAVFRRPGLALLASAERLRWPPAIGPNSVRAACGRYNPHENILNTTNVGALKVLWSHKTARFHSPRRRLSMALSIAGRMLSTQQRASSCGPRIQAGSPGGQ